MVNDEAVQDPTGTTWSVPGSQAEPQDAFTPPGTPGAAVGWRARPGSSEGPQDAQPGAAPGRPAPGDGLGFTAAGPLTRRIADGQGADVPVVQLRPMTVADILDGAFAIIKARPARILGVSALFVIPIHLLIAYMSRTSPGIGVYWDALSANDPAVRAEAASESSNDGAQFWVGILAMFLPAVALVFVAAAIAYLVAAWTAGRDVTAGQMVKVAAKRWWALLVSFVAIHVLELLGCYIGTAFVMAAFVVTAPVIGAEGLGPFKAMGRAANLGMRRFWPVLGISLLIGVVATLLENALGGLPAVLSALFDFELAWMVLAASSAAGAVISTPFVAAATVLLYLDLRIRTEGLDLEMDSAELARQAQEAQAHLAAHAG